MSHSCKLLSQELNLGGQRSRATASIFNVKEMLFKEVLTVFLSPLIGSICSRV